MATNIYPLGLERIVDEGISTMNCRLALLSTEIATYAYASTHEFFDTGTNNTADPSFCETAATNYVQKTVTPTVQLNVANTRIELVIADQTWTDLGGASNETINWAILFDYSGNLATSPLLAAFDLNDTTTNGTDFTVNFDDLNGNIRLTYTIT